LNAFKILTSSEFQAASSPILAPFALLQSPQSAIHVLFLDAMLSRHTIGRNNTSAMLHALIAHPARVVTVTLGGQHLVCAMAAKTFFMMLAAQQDLL
jgi:hypothetical protein